MNVLKIVPNTVVDGPGLRTAIYLAGCTHRCKGCHNPESWDFNQGKEYSPNELIEQLEQIGTKKVTFSGGDPLSSKRDLEELLQVLIKLKSYNYNIWIYTGYCYEYLKRYTIYFTIFKYTDVLVDGPFIESLKDSSLLYKGSSNQRLIDLQKTINNNIILYNI